MEDDSEEVLVEVVVGLLDDVVGGIADLDGSESVEDIGLGVDARLRLGGEIGRDGSWCYRKRLLSREL